MKATYVDGIMFLNSEDYRCRAYGDFVNTIKALQANGYYNVQTAFRRGYIKRGKVTRNCITTPYKGRYGTGFTVHMEYKGSTTYHIVEYYVKPE